MMRVLAITHGPTVRPELFGDVVVEEGHELVEWDIRLQGPPPPDGVDAVMVFGGDQNVAISNRTSAMIDIAKVQGQVHAQSVQKVRAKLESGAASSDKLETLVRMLESQKPQASKILIKAGGRLFLVNQKDIGFASIEEGVITVVTSGPNGMEGQSNCRTLEELLDSLDPNLFWRAHHD